MNLGKKGKDENLESIFSAWAVLRDKTKLGAVRSENDYARMSQLLDRIVDVVGSDENHPLSGLVDLVATLIDVYEDENVRIPDASPVDVLQFLMELHGLRQSDLKDEIGSQGVVSEILKGKRAINTRQAKALAKRFNVSPAVFI